MIKDISNLPDTEKRDEIEAHVYRINAMNSYAPMSKNSISKIDNDLLDVLVDVVTKLVDLPNFIGDDKTSRYAVASYTKNHFINKKFEMCITLYNVDSNGLVRCCDNDIPYYKYIAKKRGEKIDGLINKNN